MTVQRRELGERLALVLTEHGMQRMTARVIGAFLMTERAMLTQGEVAEELGAGAGSVSSAVKTLIGTGQLERVPVPSSRREHYRLRDDAWPALFSRHNEAISALWGAIQQALAETERDSVAHRRLQQMHDFYGFVFAELPELLAKWERKRAAGTPGNLATTTEPTVGTRAEQVAQADRSK